MKKLFLFAAVAVFGLFGINAQSNLNLSADSSDNTITTVTAENALISNSNVSDEMLFVEKSEDALLTENEGNDVFTGISEGNWLLTASARYRNESFGDNKDNDFTFMPRATYMATKNWGIGGEFGYMSSKSEFNGNTSSETNTFMVGAHAYHFCNPENRFTTFAGLNLDYVSENNKISDIKENGFEAGLSVGALYNLNDRWGLKTSVGALSYSSLKADTSGAEARNEFGLNFDLKNVWFGVVYKVQ